ncbi:Cytochrome P450 monooxygenase [Psilocybe cubensis]|uniref:Cytochrome P450 monooxygenase n=1 Tax=Psilocybe cubensis TaxID=181762 RepID=A0ACB8GMY8_PSICU|nr:Cytochrome P450 monooxygenase [Psilocybe cubensis]KAH9476390.1 Cytochrome P450 monooxygenase [Psilocybe cubensis]
MGVCWAIFKLLRIGRREDTLPPGPPTVPILGNAHLLPTKYPFVKLAEWGKDYDGIFSLKVANGTAEFASRPAFSGMDAVTGGRYFLTASPGTYIELHGSQKILKPSG